VQALPNDNSDDDTEVLTECRKTGEQGRLSTEVKRSAASHEGDECTARLVV